MNTYHNFKFSGGSESDINFGLLSTIVMLIGMFLVIFTTVITGNFKSASALFVPIIGTFLFLSYLTSIYPRVIYLFCFIAIIGLVLSVYIVSTSESFNKCQDTAHRKEANLIMRSHFDDGNAREHNSYSKRSIRRCAELQSMGYSYGMFFLILTLASGYYIKVYRTENSVS